MDLMPAVIELTEVGTAKLTGMKNMQLLKKSSESTKGAGLALFLLSFWGVFSATLILLSRSQ